MFGNVQSELNGIMAEWQRLACCWRCIPRMKFPGRRYNVDEGVGGGNTDTKASSKLRVGGRCSAKSTLLIILWFVSRRRINSEQFPVQGTGSSLEEACSAATYN